MRIKTIKSEKLLKDFSNKTEQYLKIVYPLEYLKRSLVRGLFDQGELVGGYVICLKGSLRVIDSLPQAVRKSYEQKYYTKDENVCEFTGLWLDKSVKGKFVNFMFWTQMYLDVITSKKEYMVYAYGVKKTKLGKLYSILNPEILYKGETKIMPGMNYAEEECIEIASVSYMRWAFFHRGDFLLKKLFLPRSLCNKNTNALLPGMFKLTKRLLARV